MTTTESPNLVPVPADPEGERAARIRENYIRLYEAIRHERPRPSRGYLNRVE